MSPPHRNISRRSACAGIASALILARNAPAQQRYPAKAITLVVPAAAGGGLDVSMRHIAKFLADSLSVPVLVENRPGVNLLIGTRHVAAAPPDGYTLLAISNTFVGAPIFADAPGYDPFRDFIAVAPTAQAPNLLLVNAGSGIYSVRDLVERAKRSGADKLTFGSAGVGSSPHVAAALFAKAAGVELTDVPYKGAAPALIDLLGGRISFLFDSVSSALPHLKSGALRALAASTVKRSPLVPEVPTLAEVLGQPDFDLPLFYGIAVPANTPAEPVRALHAALTRAAADTGIRERFAALGFDTQSVDAPADYSRFLNQQFEKFRRLKA
ncbi:MAG: tripartite tricarboxylate transporter substrate binding protein [Betaproteobacteria bacterium]